MVCIGKNIANCHKIPQFFPVLCCAQPPPRFGGALGHGASMRVCKGALHMGCTVTTASFHRDRLVGTSA